MKSAFARIRQQRTARLRGKRFLEQVIVYLTDQEYKTDLLDERDHYRFCRRLVSFLLEGWKQPFVAAFYYSFGRHPDKLIPEWLARTEKDGRMEIPDYDASIELHGPPPRLGLMSQVSASSWPDFADSLRNPPQEEHFGQSQIPRSISESLAGPDSWLAREEQRRRHARVQRRSCERKRLLNMCTQCRNPVCEESICLCALHLERAREAAMRNYVRKRLAMGKTVQHNNKAWQSRRMREAIDNLIGAGFCGS
jgi:hypothetical protein